MLERLEKYQIQNPQIILGGEKVASVKAKEDIE